MKDVFSTNIKHQDVALTNEQLRRSAPAIFAENPHARLSERYKLLRTIDAVDALRERGLVPVAAWQSQGKRSVKTIEYGAHFVWFRQENFSKPLLGEIMPMVRLGNSHDGAKSYELSIALLRLVCNNGLAVGRAAGASVKMRHNEDALETYIDAAYEVVGEAKQVAKGVKEWRGITLSEDKQRDFAREAQLAYYADRPQLITFDSGLLLNARRHEDEGDDVWRVMNRVQENLVRGGLETVERTGAKRRRQTQGIADQRRANALNARLWDLADTYAKAA